MPDSYEKQKRLALRLANALMVGTVTFFLVKYALSAAISLAVSLGASAALRPAAKVFSERTRIPLRVCGAVLSALTVLFIGFVSTIVTAKLVAQLGEFLSGLVTGLEKEDNVLRRTIDYFSNLRERIPLFEKLGTAFGKEASNRVYSVLTDLLRSGVQNVSEWTASLAGGLVASLPGALLTATVVVTGIYYFTTDPDGVEESFLSLLPKESRGALSGMRRKFRSGAVGYIKAYLLILQLTFCELLAGLLILRFRYAFLIAAAVALIDLLPVIGSGTVLFPWAVILFVAGDARRATGLLILLAVMFVVRQIAEPRLIGKQMGHHPFVSLFAAYLGFRLLGVAGMIAAPIGVFVLQTVRENEGNADT